MSYELVDAPQGRFELLDKPPLKIGAEGFADAAKAAAIDANPHPLTQFLVGAQTGIGNIGYRLGQLAGVKLSPQQEQEVQFGREFGKEYPMGILGKVGGEMLLTGKPSASAYSGVNQAVGKVLPQFLSKSVGAGTVGGGMGFLTEPVLSGESGATNTENAAVGGVLGDAALRGGARVAQPILQSPQVKALLAKDIVPSMGSAAGGLLRNIEDKATSLPLVGSLIQNARRRSVEDFNRAAIGMAMPPGVKAQEVGDAGIAAAKNELGGAYDKVYGNAQVGIDKQFLQDVFAAKSSTTIPLSRAGAKQFDEIIQRDVLDRLPGVTKVPASQAKMEIEADLGKAAREMKASTLASERAVGEALQNARDAFRDLMARHVGPDAAKLPPLNQARAILEPVKNAAERAKAAGGVFTPYQLQAQARPGTDIRELANNAQGVLPNTIANSGTTDRALAALLYGGGAAGAAAPVFGAPYVAALGAAPLMYSRLGSRYMLGDLPGQGILSSQLRALAPYGAAAGGILRGQQ